MFDPSPVLKGVGDIKVKEKPDAKLNKVSGNLRAKHHPDNPATCERNKPEGLPCPTSNQQVKVYVKTSYGRGQVPSKQTQEIDTFSPVILILESRTQKSSYGMFFLG